MADRAARTDPARARKLAEQCFNVARSTSFEGERTAAIARGEAIAARAGLSLDSFDIPGREKAKAEAPKAHRGTAYYTGGPFGSGARFDDLHVDIDEMLRRAKATRTEWNRDPHYRSYRERAFDDLSGAMDRAAREAGARPDETVYDARRRAFDEATTTPNSEGLRRFDLKNRWPSIDAVINALRARRVLVHPARVRVSSLTGVTPPALWIVSEPEYCVFDQWSLRELADVVVG